MTKPPSAAQTFLVRHSRALIASIALAVGLAWVMKKGALPLLPPQGTLDHLDWTALVLMTIALLVSMLIRFVRYQLLLAPIAKIPMRRVFAIQCLATGLITFLPFRLGEFARPAMLREKGKVSGWAVTGTVGAERIIDGVAFGATLMLGLFFARPHEPLPDHIGDLPVPAAFVPRAAQLATLGFGAAFVVMGVFFWWRAAARRLTERVFGIVSARFGAKVADVVESMSDGLRFLPNFRYTGAFLGATVLALYTHIWSMQELALAVGLPALTLAQATVVVGVLGLGFAMPNAPGFFGSIQLALYAGLAVYVKPSQVVHEGAALVFLFYVIYLALVIALSLIGLLLEYRAKPIDTLPVGTPERP